MKHRFLSLTFIACLLAGCTITEDGVTEKDSYIYLGSTSSNFYLPTTYFEDTKDVPYVSLNDFYGDIFSLLVKSSGLKNGGYSVSSGTVTNKANNATMIFDVDSNTIYSDDYDQFVSNSSNSSDPYNMCSVSTDTLASYSDKSSYKKGSKITFDLSKYNVKLFKHDNKVYVPFSFIEPIATSFAPFHFSFNGDNFYLMDGSGMRDKNGNLTEYGTSYYSGSLNKSSTRSQSYADYNYNSFLFLMENFEGHFSRLGISSLDSKLDELGIKSKITSTDAETSSEGIAEAINRIFGDGGHTGFTSRGLGCSYNSEKDISLRQDIYNYDTRCVKSRETHNTLSALRGKLTKNLEISGETAIIRFDSFSLNDKDKSPTKADVENDTTSTFAIIYNSFNTIKQNSSIKNVVFDVSLNGGGALPAMTQALSFMTDDSILLKITNTLTGAVSTIAVDYDNNLDGNTTDNDSYAGKYNFYILSSYDSFSCGNAFPIIAQEYGYAKVIGETSGGGDCSITNTYGADGTSWVMSSDLSMTRKDGSNFDNGATPDIELDSSYFYDAAKLDEKLSSLN